VLLPTARSGGLSGAGFRERDGEEEGEAGGAAQPRDLGR